MKISTILSRAVIVIVFLGSVVTLTNCKSKDKMKIKMLPYPDAIKENVADNYHGNIVEDPYRWLENDNSKETAAWVSAENTVTQDYLSHIPYREAIKTRLTQLWNYPQEGVPTKYGEWYYSFRNDGLQNQSVLYRQKNLGDSPELFLDPNTLSEDGTVALGSVTFSEDAKHCAYTISTAGSDWVEIRVMDTETKKVLPDHIKWVKFSSANWDADSEGFYYNRYDEPEKGKELSAQNQFQKVYYHKLGDEQSKDILIHMDENHPLRYFSGTESKDGKYIFITASEGTHGNEILVRETDKKDAPFRTLLKGFENDYSLIHCNDDIAYFYTNNKAKNFRVVSVDLKRPNAPMKNVIAEGENLLEGARVVGDYIAAFYLEDATSSVYQHKLDGELVRKVELPGIGSVSGFSGKKDAVETFYSLTTYTSPQTIYRYDLEEGKSKLIRKPKVNFDSELYTTDQLFFKSKDGTEVPMFIVHRKDMVLNGKNPLHLYGYGGFNINMTPGFNPNNIMFLEQGGIFVVVNLRGGGEYGEEWHRGGMLENKQNVFDDFIGAAEYLIENKYTSKEKLAISGGSNGGLLVGACMTQRPDLYAVTFPIVGVLDMLRYHMFTIGWGWAVEYGSSENEEQFKYLYEYSPLHNIKSGTCYPATMIMTADHDDRVVPAHSFKFAATLQAAQGCDNPALIRIDTKAGHGAGKPTTKKIDEAADMYSFLFWNTDTEVSFKNK